MPTITIPLPTDCASAIRCVCYVRAWSMRQLAAAMGLRDATMLSKLVRHKVNGTPEMLARILGHMPAMEAK